MKIAVLGWGSLIGDPRTLRTDGTWRPDGPWLPIEFSRVSSADHLTAVIDETHGARLRTYWTVSQLESLEEAIENLRAREGRRVGTEQIGFFLSGKGQQEWPLATRRVNHRYRLQSVLPELRSWADQSDCDAVIWTDLEPNFEQKTGRPFTVENALSYLKGLDGKALEKAEEYMRKAPVQTETPVRQRARTELGWTNLSER